MADFLKKLFGNIKTLWGRWSFVQRAVLVGIVVVAIIGIAALFSVSSSPNLVAVIDAPITNEDARHRIIMRINEEGIRTSVTSNGIIQVADEATARRMRTLLIREDLIPRGVDPWAVFDRERWTITDLERNVNLQRAHNQMITDHIRAVDGVDNAHVSIVWPQRTLFTSSQNPPSAAITIIPKPGSDITRNRNAIEGIQRLTQFAIEGLNAENIVITDHLGNIINNFEGMAALDRLSLLERERRQVQTEEAALRVNILRQLQSTFSEDRVRDLNVSIVMDMSHRTVETREFFPIEMSPQTPGVPFVDRVVVPSIARSTSSSDTTWRGTGMNPEGPPGVEGQTPPAFREMSEIFGEMSQVTNVTNVEINERSIVETRSPQPDRISVSVNIDGVWTRVFDERGNPVILPDGTIQREFTPLPEDQRRQAEELVRVAIGYNAARGDSVTVQNIPFDRRLEFQAEDAEYFRQRQLQTTIIVILFGIAALLVGFLIFKVISREMERRKRLAEEERTRREQMLRESEMQRLEEDGLDVSISVSPGDRERMELMESVVTLTKEHPEDCAQLIRTWLLEE
jgi:flagellar M-ring protein FliF